MSLRTCPPVNPPPHRAAARASQGSDARQLSLENAVTTCVHVREGGAHAASMNILRLKGTLNDASGTLASMTGLMKTLERLKSSQYGAGGGGDPVDALEFATQRRRQAKKEERDKDAAVEGLSEVAFVKSEQAAARKQGVSNLSQWPQAGQLPVGGGGGWPQPPPQQPQPQWSNASPPVVNPWAIGPSAPLQGAPYGLQGYGVPAQTAYGGPAQPQQIQNPYAVGGGPSYALQQQQPQWGYGVGRY